MINQLSSIPVVVGPTASGKSDLGIAIALELDGEIINLDSVQVYQDLYVATAKVPLNERRNITHHLIDIVEPAQPFNAGDYAKLASTAIADIESRRRRPVLVGGTGFYLRALMHPLFESPQTATELRRRLSDVRNRKGPEHLYRMLERVDPAAASVSSPRNWSRTMRALEFYFQTGKRISAQRPNTPEAPPFASRVRVIALNPPRDELYRRINERADRMFEEGLIAEVESLLKRGVPKNAKAFQAHGYRRVIEYLEGLRTRDEALEQMKLDTRHYAKRQLTWWRAWPGVHWIDRFGDSEAADQALAFIEQADLELAVQLE